MLLIIFGKRGWGQLRPILPFVLFCTVLKMLMKIVIFFFLHHLFGGIIYIQ